MSTIGPKIILEGEKEYRKAIGDVNSSMRVLRSEMRAVSAEFDGNANSVDALRKKNEVLSKQQAEQEKRVKLLRGALEGATKEFGANSRQVNTWQTQLNNASAYLLKLNRDIENNQKYMKEAEQSTDKTAKSIDEFGKQVDGASQKTSIFGDVLKANLASDAISNGVKKLARELGTAIEESIELASDLEEVQNVVDVTFGEGADVIDSWADSIGRAHGVSTLYAKEYVGVMGSMLKSMDLADDQVLEMSKNLVELAGDMASFYNVDTQTMFEKIRSGISGQIVPLQQLGINLKVSSLEAFALAEGMEKTYAQMDQAEQSVLRYNYLMKVTADAQGDFTRNIDSLANQQRIADLQREEMLMKLGDAVIPAVTRATVKLNEAMDGMGDNMAEVAEILAEGIVDAFIWLVDNSDKVIAGLKGIGAAILTKKAGDGVLYVVSAYKTLTTATVTATVAQEGFNKASKANIYVAIASAIIGISTALFSYAKSARDATDETEKLNRETQKLIDKSKQLREKIDERSEAYRDETDSIKAEYGALEILANKLYDLSDKENKTNAEKEQMVALVEQLNKALPSLNLTIDKQTGLLGKQREELERLISSNRDYVLVKAAEDRYMELANERMRAEIELAEKQEVLRERSLEVGWEAKKKQYEEYVRFINMDGFVSIGERAKEQAYFNIYNEADTAVRGLADEVNALKDTLNENEKQWAETEEYINGFSGAMGTASSEVDNFNKKYQKVLDEQTQAEIGTIEDRQKQISKIYDQTSKELDKQLRIEERAFAKSQQKRVEAVQEAQEAELKEVEKTHKAKLDLLDEEYLEKIRVENEDRYEELKAVQDEIDFIDNQQEAEDRALQAREDAEKKAELQARVENAKTIEERMDAQKELQKHEERVARERLKGERRIEKDILKERMDTINKGYDETIKALEAEKKEKQESYAEQLTAEKEGIAERYKLKLEALKDEQELEKDAFRDRQNEYKEYLREQKELAIANSKEIYEADLAKFKMNQALKYEETVSSEAQMKKAIQEHAYKNMQPGQARDNILRTNDLEEMLKYYNPSSAIRSSVPQSQSIDYSMVEDAMSRAVKKLNLSVTVNNKVLGEIVDEHIRRNLRR